MNANLEKTQTDEYIITYAKHKASNMESLFYGVTVVGFFYLGYSFIHNLVAYLSDTFALTRFPVVYLLLWVLDIILIIFVSIILVRRHLLVTNISVYICQNGFNETEIALNDIVNIETQKDNVIIKTETGRFAYTYCANNVAIAKQIMVLKQNNINIMEEEQ